MKITIKGYRPIVLRDRHVSDDKFTGDTPYDARLLHELKKPSYLSYRLPAKLTCLMRLRATAERLGGYSSYLDALAGVGLSARVLGADVPRLMLNERDPWCQEILSRNFSVKVTGHDLCTWPTPPVDAVFLDFNAFTFKRYLDERDRPGSFFGALDRAFSSAKRFVFLNDCTPFYFRYGAGAFKNYGKLLGLPVASHRGYFLAAAFIHEGFHPGWHMVHAAYFRDSSFQLFARDSSEPLTVEEVRREDLEPGLVTAEEDDE